MATSTLRATLICAAWPGGPPAFLDDPPLAADTTVPEPPPPVTTPDSAFESSVLRQFPQAVAIAHPRQRAPGPQAMVACAHCGLHLPQPDAVEGEGGRHYCSAEHRRLGPRNGP